MHSGMFFVYKHSSPNCYAEKSRRFKQQMFLRGYAKKNVGRDQDLIATLGFFDQEKDEPINAPLDQLFSQPTIEVSKDLPHETTRKPENPA